MTAPRIGILAFQGAVQDHLPHLHREGAEVVLVRRTEELKGLNALIIPGGESSVTGRFLQAYGMTDPIRALAESGMPVWGICAGAIVMAGMVDNKPSPGLALLDFHAIRNSYGRQLSSGSRLVMAPGFLEEKGEPMPFIRAPRFELPETAVSARSGGAGKAAWLEDGSPAAIIGGWNNHLLASAFHPELTASRGFHRWIVEKARSFNLQD